VAGANITPPVTVQLRDQFGNKVASGGVQIVIDFNPLGAPRTAGNIQVTDGTGLATFSTLSRAAAGNYRLQAASPSIESALSNPFEIMTGPPTLIAAGAGTPQSATISTPFTLPLVARVTDGRNNPVSGVTVAFTVPGSGASAILAAPSAKTD
jgi:hypothetical protein